MKASESAVCVPQVVFRLLLELLSANCVLLAPLTLTTEQVQYTSVSPVTKALLVLEWATQGVTIALPEVTVL